MKFPPTILAIDTETNGLNPHDPRVKAGVISWYGKIGSKDISGCKTVSTIPAGLVRTLVGSTALKLFFNAKFDIQCLRNAQVNVAGPIFDISVALRLLYPDELQYTLKHFARKINGDIYEEELVLKEYIKKNKLSKWVKIRGYVDLIPDHILFPYCQKDSEQTYKLFQHTVELLTERKLWGIMRKETKLLPIIMAMEQTGIAVDKEYATNLLDEAENRLRALLVSMRKIVGDKNFNPASPKQVAAYLKNLTSDPRLTKTGQVSTDKVALLVNSNKTPLISRLIEFRELSKASTTYVANVLKSTKETDTFRVSFNQMGALTGRFSCSGYAVKGQIQNIPRPNQTTVLGRIRNLFVARDKFTLAFFDYDQIEMRLRAHYSKDQGLIDAINRNEDIHIRTALQTIGKNAFNKNPIPYRQVFKTINYALQYGVGVEKLGLTILKESKGKIRLSSEECASLLGGVKDNSPHLMNLFAIVEDEVAMTGGVRNPFGRFILVDPNKAYTGVNYLIQSTVADIIKDKMLLLDAKLKEWSLSSNIKMILQIHDELVFEMSEQTGNWTLQEIRDIMEDYDTFSIPLTVSVSKGKQWGMKKKVELDK